MQGTSRKFSYANVVATICLFLLLGTGVALGAKKLISGSKIKPHTITAKQIKAKSLNGSLFKGGLPSGPTGPSGPQGPGAISLHFKGAAVEGSTAQPVTLGTLGTITYTFSCLHDLTNTTFGTLTASAAGTTFEAHVFATTMGTPTPTFTNLASTNSGNLASKAVITGVTSQVSASPITVVPDNGDPIQQGAAYLQVTNVGSDHSCDLEGTITPGG